MDLFLFKPGMNASIVSELKVYGLYSSNITSYSTTLTCVDVFSRRGTCIHVDLEKHFAKPCATQSFKPLPLHFSTSRPLTDCSKTTIRSLIFATTYLHLSFFFKIPTYPPKKNQILQYDKLVFHDRSNYPASSTPNEPSYPRTAESPVVSRYFPAVAGRKDTCL